MYNRYVPQNDGSFRRNWVPDPPPGPPAPSHPPRPEPPKPSPPPPSHPPKPPQPGVGNFLKQLIPRDFCTEDLLVVILLLLMAGDCKEDQNNALLTLALYLFL